MFRSSIMIAAIVPMLASIALSPASAQMGPGGPGAWQGAGPGSHMWGGGPGGWWDGPDAMDSRIDGRLAFLKAELKITDAQNAAWDKVAAAVRASTESMVDRMKSVFAGDQKDTTLPQRLDIQEQFMTARLDEIKQVKSALTDLYAVLSDDQKKEADNLVLPMMGMGMMGGWGMMGGGRGMGPGMMWRR